MDILSYLSELIKTQKEIGIAGLGTILKKKSPGRYDAETHTFLPPSYVLDFKTEVREEESLAVYISKQKNISPDAAAYFIGLFAEDLQNQLKASQQASLGALGSLELTDGHLIFKASDKPDIGFDFYGLPSVKEDIAREKEAVDEPELVLRPEAPEGIEEQNELEERLDLEDANADLSDGTREFDEQPVYEEISEHVQPAAAPVSVFIETPEGAEEEELTVPEPLPVRDTPVVIYAEEAEPKEEPATGTPGYVWFILAGVILLAAVIGLYVKRPDLFGRNNEQEVATVLKNDQHRTDSVSGADSLKRPLPVAAEDTAKTDTAIVTKPLLDTDTATTWEVIGASVLNQKEVNQVLEQFKKSGITGKVMPHMPGKRRIKISIATYRDEMSARKGRKELVDKLKDPELYIFQYKHTHK